jgi:hypothetical protein
MSPSSGRVSCEGYRGVVPEFPERLKTSVGSRCCNRWSSTCWLPAVDGCFPQDLAGRTVAVGRPEREKRDHRSQTPRERGSGASGARDPDRLRQRDRQIVRWIGRGGDATGPDAVPIRDRSHEPRRAARRDSRRLPTVCASTCGSCIRSRFPLTPTRGSTNGW